MVIASTEADSISKERIYIRTTGIDMTNVGIEKVLFLHLLIILPLFHPFSPSTHNKHPLYYYVYVYISAWACLRVCVCVHALYYRLKENKRENKREAS